MYVPKLAQGAELVESISEVSPIGDLDDAANHRGKLLEHTDHDTGLKYELFLPNTQLASPNELYPVIVFLHGAGESANFPVMNSQSLPR